MEIWANYGGPVNIRLDVDESRELAEMLERVPDDRHRRAEDLARDIRGELGPAGCR